MRNSRVSRRLEICIMNQAWHLGETLGLERVNVDVSCAPVPDSSFVVNVTRLFEPQARVLLWLMMPSPRSRRHFGAIATTIEPDDDFEPSVSEVDVRRAAVQSLQNRTRHACCTLSFLAPSGRPVKLLSATLTRRSPSPC